MLTLRDRGPRLCDGLSRRDVLQAGGLGALGLSLPQLLAREALAKTTESAPRSAKSCIVLFLMGGSPQHSTFDPKPEAPPEIRGVFSPIATSVPGTCFSELLPGLAQRADQLAVLRAVSTTDNAHSSSGYYMLTGHPHVPMNAENANPGAPNDWPFLGTFVQQATPPRGDLPGCVRLPHHIFNTDNSVWPGQDAGFLGRSADPWLFRCQPASPEFRIPEFSLPVEITSDRLLRRGSLLESVNQRFDQIERAGLAARYSELSGRAFNLLASQRSRSAFRLDLETPQVREQYGISQFGQSTLLARRLVEAGVRLVQVNWYRGPDEPSDAPCWDSHAGEANRLKNVLCPPMDQAFSALLDDLSQRGILDETLVVCLTEFGRTPRMNARGGRDHWGSVFSVALAGGGIRGGVVHGESDEIGAFPKSGLVRPEDITATIFHCLGLAPETELHDPQGRPFPISRGRVLHEILA